MSLKFNKKELENKILQSVLKRKPKKAKKKKRKRLQRAFSRENHFVKTSNMYGFQISISKLLKKHLQKSSK